MAAKVVPLTLDNVANVHVDFQPLVASALAKEIMARVEENKKDVEALDAGLELFSSDFVLPAFGKKSRDEWIKMMKKAKKKALKKKKKRQKLNRLHVLFCEMRI